MANVLVENKSLEDIAAAIRGKNGESTTYTPGEMAGAVNNLPIDDGKLSTLIDGSITELTKADFGNIKDIRVEAFWQCFNLVSVDMPDTIETIGNNAFSGCGQLTNVNMSKGIKSIGVNSLVSSVLKDLYFLGPNIPKIETNSFYNSTKLHVPGYMFEDYKKAPNWGTIYLLNLVPEGAYVEALPLNKIMTFDKPGVIQVNYSGYETTPNYTITLNKDNVVSYTSSAENGVIKINLTSLKVEDNVELTLTVDGDEGRQFIYKTNVNVYAQLEAPSYTVEAIPDAAHGFTLNDAGYYESTNKGISSSYSICKIHIINKGGFPMYLDCINYAESDYDYSILSNVNQTLGLNADADSVYHYSFKGLQSPDVRTVEYTDTIGDCFITVKYRKDGSGDTNNDSLQFKVRFGE